MAVRPRLSCPGGRPGYPFPSPVPAVLSQLICKFYRVLAILSSLSCPGCPDVAILWCCPVLAVMS
jgi:hypothetical protein